ncbi:MAG: hypothetical protein WCO42_05530 [bacterium]
MPKITFMLGGIVVLLITSSLAFYYRSQAIAYQQDYDEAMARLSQMTAVAVATEPAVTREEGVRETPDVSRDADNRPPLRRESESQLAAKEPPPPIAGVTKPPRSAESDRSRRRSSDWMENLRTNDPPRYAELQQRRQTMSQTMQNAWAQANDYFMNRDTSKMAPTDLAEYTTMIKLLGQASSLNQQLQSGVAPEVRQQVAADLRSNIVAVAPLLENERNREYYDAALAMGQSDQEAATFVSYINQIASNTSLRAIIPGIRVGGMRGGGPSSAGRDY